MHARSVSSSIVFSYRLSKAFAVLAPRRANVDHEAARTDAARDASEGIPARVDHLVPLSLPDSLDHLRIKFRSESVEKLVSA